MSASSGWRVDIRSETEFATEEADMAFDEEEASGRCSAILSNGKRCPNAALAGSRYCGHPAHQALEGKDSDQVEEAEPETPAAEAAEPAPEAAAAPEPEAPERAAEEVIEPVASGEPEPEPEPESVEEPAPAGSRRTPTRGFPGAAPTCTRMSPAPVRRYVVAASNARSGPPWGSPTTS